MKKITDLMLKLNEIDFRSHDQYKKYKGKHKMRPTTKVSIGGKETTAGDADKVIAKKDKIQRGAPKTDPKPLDKLAKMGMPDIDKAIEKYKGEDPQKFVSKIEQEFIKKGKENRDKKIGWEDVQKFQDKLDDAGVDASISYDYIANELEYDVDDEDWYGDDKSKARMSPEARDDAAYGAIEMLGDMITNDMEYDPGQMEDDLIALQDTGVNKEEAKELLNKQMADLEANYDEDEWGGEEAYPQEYKDALDKQIDGLWEDDDYASGFDDSDVPSDKFRDTLDYDDEDGYYDFFKKHFTNDTDKSANNIKTFVKDNEDAVRSYVNSVVSDNMGTSEAAMEYLGWSEEEAEDADSTVWDDVVDKLMDDPEEMEEFISGIDLDGDLQAGMDQLKKAYEDDPNVWESAKSKLGTIIKEEIANVIKERYKLKEGIKKTKIKGYDYPSHDINEFTGRPIPMDTPNEFAYLDFKKYVYKKRGMFKKEMLKHVRKSDGQADSSRMFMTLSALWYKWAYHNNKEFTHIKNKLKFGRELMKMMVQDDLIFSKDGWKKDNRITHVKESILRGQLAGDSALDMANHLRQYGVKQILKQPNDRVTYFHLNSISQGRKVVAMLKKMFGIKAQIDNHMYSPSPAVKFDNDQLVESKLNEASGSWLTKKIFDDLNKELKRTEPNMYKNRYFKKAFSMYLHDLDSMEYSKLGRERFKHLDKAWNYIDKNTEALSSTNDKLNRAHIRSQFDGPVYYMLKYNTYKLK